MVLDDASVEWSPGPNIAVTVPEGAAALEVTAAWQDEAAPTTFESRVHRASAAAADADASSIAAAPAAPAAAAASAPAASTRAQQGRAVANFLSPDNPTDARLDPSTLDSLTLPKLKALALKVGVATGGRKKELAARLRAALAERAD